MINHKYSKMTLTGSIVKEMISETQNRFANIGLKVDLTVDPRTGYFTFDVIGRINQNTGFDHEQKQWEVKKAKERNETIQEIV